MSSQTTRMKLKRPDGTDPFLRQDFVDNLNTQDQYPGLYPCTSTTRPVWGAAQNGMCIVETDTRRILQWYGTSWGLVNQYGAAVGLSVTPQVTLGKGTETSYTLGTVSLPRDARLYIIGGARVQQQANLRQGVSIDLTVDGTQANFGFPSRQVWPEGGSGAVGQNVDVLSLWGYRSVNAGNHTIGCKVYVDTLSNDGVHFYGAKATVLIME